jgi:flagellar biosynthesis anti-sigma factor FlgM
MNTLDATGNYERPGYVKEPAESSRVEIHKQQPTERKKETSRENIIVSLSDTCKEMKLAKEAVASAPEIRSEKVERIREAILEDRYRIHADKIAEKIIGSIITEFA